MQRLPRSETENNIYQVFKKKLLTFLKPKVNIPEIISLIQRYRYQYSYILNKCLEDRDLVKTLISHNLLLELDITYPAYTIDTIVIFNNIELLKYFFQKNWISKGYSTKAMDLSASLGYKDVFLYLDQHPLSKGCTSYALDMAHLKKHKEIIKYLKQKEDLQPFLESLISS